MAKQQGIIDRRSFLGAVALGAAAVAGLAGCSNHTQPGADPSDGEGKAASAEPEDVAETLDVDIWIGNPFLDIFQRARPAFLNSTGLM